MDRTFLLRGALLLAVLVIVLQPEEGAAQAKGVIPPLIGQITKVEGNEIEINLGRKQGIKIGQMGKVFYDIVIDSRAQRIYIADLQVEKVSADSCLAKVRKRPSGEIRPGYKVKFKIGILDINTDPEGANIYLDGEEQLDDVGKPKRTRESLEVAPGKYQLRLEKRFYNPVARTVVVEGGETTRIVQPLDRQRVDLMVKSDPPLKATVEVAGRTSQTGEILRDIEAGGYELKVTRNGYHPFSQQIVAEGQELQIAEVRLEPVILEIFTVPSGGTVQFNGRESVAPVTIEPVLDGEHLVVASKQPEFVETAVTVQVKREQDGRVDILTMDDRVSLAWEGRIAKLTIQLDLAPAKLVVWLNPANEDVINFQFPSEGIDVSLDGEPKGKVTAEETMTMPVVIERLPSRRCQLIFSSPPFIDLPKIVDVEPGQEVHMELEMGGSLRLSSMPQGVEVYLDDKRANIPSSTGLLMIKWIPEGMHRLRLWHPRYVDEVQDIEIQQGKMSELERGRDIRLQLKRGHLLLEVWPGNAKVYLDGEYQGDVKGNEPFVLYGLPIGKYSLSVLKDGFENWEKEIAINHQGITWQFAGLEMGGGD